MSEGNSRHTKQKKKFKQINKQSKMKNSTLQFSFIFTFVVAFAVSSFAEKKVYDGYVIKYTDEKIEGKIEMLSPALNEVKVKFISKDGKITVFKAKEVKEYGFKVERWNHETRQHYYTNITYVKKDVVRSPIAFGPTNVLLERQETGAVNMYNHFIEQNSNVQEPFAHIVYVEKTKNDLVEINSDNYKQVLKEMFAEYPELQAKVGSRGHGYKHIATMINTFNTWMVDNGEEVVLN